MRSSTIARAPIVRLADVAEVFADDPAVVEGLSLIALCPAPGAGSERTLTQHELRQILVHSGVERESVHITGSQHVTVLVDMQPLWPRAISRSYDSAVQVQQASFAQARAEAAQTGDPPPAQPPAVETPAAPPPRLIDRGNAVTVFARAAGIRVTASGKALGHGASGETIVVELEDSRERVLGRVVAPHTVEVLVSPSIAPNRPASVPPVEGDE